MSKYIFIIIAMGALVLLISTSKISSKENASERITILPAPADSISEISINLVGDLMCHLPQTNNAKLSNGEFNFNPSFEYFKLNFLNK
jgi:hypothetical protein